MHVNSAAGHFPAELSVFGEQIRLWITPIAVPLSRGGLKSLGIYNTYESRAFLRLYCEYFIFYTRFSLNMSPSLPPSLLTFLLRCRLFLGRLYVHYRSPKPFV